MNETDKPLPTGHRTIRMKELIIRITGTSRKEKEFERAIRTFIKEYKNKHGVYDVDVEEQNIVIKKLG